MSIALIVAASTNNAIGKESRLPWNLPEDLKFFKNKTWGLPVIMGRKTFEAMGKALPGRTNIVITNNEAWKADNAIKVSNIDDALKAAADTGAKEAFITGGGEIFRQSMDIADTIYMTRVHADLAGDTFFPEIDPLLWTLDFERNMPADEKHAYALSFQTWKKSPHH